MKIFKKAKKGFTLVELVVVIAVIAILAAVSVGAYFGVTESANNSRLEQESKQVYTAIQTVALAPNEHSNLDNTGLTISDPVGFKDALVESLGKDVALSDEQDSKDNDLSTICFFKLEQVNSLLGDTKYDHFEYHIPGINGKKAVVNAITGDCDVIETDAEGENIPDTVNTITDALAAEVGTNAILTGTVTEITQGWSEGYKNMSFILTDSEENSILVYRCNSQVELGDIVKVSGSISEYEEVNQIAQGSTAVITGHDISYDKEPITTIADALLAEDGYPVVLTGEVVNIKTQYNATNKNISLTIKDESGNSIFAYKLNGNAAIHDIITITGFMGTHNEERQIAEAASFVKNDVAECSTFNEASCTKSATCTLCNKPSGDPLGHTEGDENGNCTRCGTNVAIQEHSITFDSDSKRISISNEQQVWTEDGITVTNDKDKSTNNVASYTNPVRFYKGSKVTVNFPINDIDEIKIVSSPNDPDTYDNPKTYFDYLKESLNGIEGITFTDNGTNEVTITNYKSDTLEFSCAGGQVRLFSISLLNDTRNVEPETPVDPTPDPEEPTVYTLTINTDPADANVVLVAGENTVNAKTIEVEANTSVTYTISKDGYDSVTDTITVTETTTLNITLKETEQEQPKQIVFKASTSTTNDSSTELKTSDFISKGISSNDINGLACTDISKVYNGKAGYGIKFGTGSATGKLTLTMNLSNVKQIIINSAKYSSDTGKLKVTVGDSLLKEFTPTSSASDTTIDVNNSITKLTIATSAKRAYLLSITFVF